MEVYVAGEDHWLQLQSLAVPRHGIGAALSGTRLVVPGGGIKQGLGATAHTDALDLSDGLAVCRVG